MELYSRKEISQFFGIHGRTIQHWVDWGLVNPQEKSPGKGTGHLFSDFDVHQIVVIDWLRRNYELKLFVIKQVLDVLDPIIGMFDEWQGQNAIDRARARENKK